MNKQKSKKERMSNLTIVSLLTFLFFFIVAVVVIELFRGVIEIKDILILIDVYAKLILTSWPASILLIAFIVLIRHHDSIDYFIRERMTEVGPGGVKGSIEVGDATDSEMKQKTIKEEKEDDKVIEEINIDREDVNVESGVVRPKLNSKKEEVVKRYKRISQIEDAVQTSLIDKYNDRYKSKVRISAGDKKVIVDGILYSKKGKIQTAVEIKSISSKSYDALRFIIARKLRQLSSFGIKHLTLILVGENINQEVAQKIQEENLHQAKIYFYNWDNENLTEVEIPTRNNHFF